MRRARLEETARHHDLRWAGDVFDGFEAAWPDAFRASVTIFDDVAAFLDRCRAVGAVVGALTNSSRPFTELKLEAVGLDDAFTAVMTTDTLGFGKPDPRVFTHACRLLGASPGDTVCVGDDLEVDARAARDAGLVGVWLDRRGRPAPGDVLRVTTLADVPITPSS